MRQKVILLCAGDFFKSLLDCLDTDKYNFMAS